MAGGVRAIITTCSMSLTQPLSVSKRSSTHTHTHTHLPSACDISACLWSTLATSRCATSCLLHGLLLLCGTVLCLAVCELCPLCSLFAPTTRFLRMVYWCACGIELCAVFVLFAACSSNTTWFTVTNGDNIYDPAFWKEVEAGPRSANVVAFDFYSRYQRYTGEKLSAFTSQRPACTAQD